MDIMMQALKSKEKYYWETEQGEFIPVQELTDLHVCNIVALFGKKWLKANGYINIADRFENLNQKYSFFKISEEDKK